MTHKTSSKSNTLAFPHIRPNGASRSSNGTIRPDQAHVLDWRQRAHGFGLEVDEREDVEEDRPFGVTPSGCSARTSPRPSLISRCPLTKQLKTSRRKTSSSPRKALPARTSTSYACICSTSASDRLLKAHEEVAIGQRIETAQRDLVAALGRHSGGRADARRAVPTAFAPEGRSRRGADSAARRRRAARRAHRTRCSRPSRGSSAAAMPSTSCADSWPTRGWACRHAAGSTAQLAARAEGARGGSGRPAIRPSLVDDVVTELREMDQGVPTPSTRCPRRAERPACRARNSRRAAPRRVPTSDSHASRLPRTRCAKPSAS